MCSQSVFSVLPENIDCVPLPLESQICGVVILPYGAPTPGDWNDIDSWLEVLDNGETQGLKGKYFICTGDVPEAQDIEVNLGRSNRKVVNRVYDLNFYPQWFDATGYTFFRNLQTRIGWNPNFRFWFATIGGRLLGGANGIVPSFLTAKAIYSGEIAAREQIKVNIQWKSICDPDRIHKPELFGTTEQQAYGNIARSLYLTNVLFFAQYYIEQIGNTLTWTENGGILPTTNQGSLVAVFQGGQKLLTSQYTISGSSVIIDPNTHWDGATYQILASIPQ